MAEESQARGDPITESVDEEAPQILEPEDDVGARDEDSTFGGSTVQESTASLVSSVLNYRYENGRRYHAFREGEYVIPNDETEQDRMDLQHHIHTLVAGGALVKAPLSPHIERVLDLGTGTGIWAIDMADEYPSATVIGIDLSPIQPGWVPPNCKFELDDFESDWTFSQPFDFIHGRSLAGSVKNHHRLLQQSLEHLRPEGWLELVDFAVWLFSDDGTLEKATNILEWQERVSEASVKFGKPMNVAHRYKEWMEDTGFKNVKEHVYKVPISPWPKDRKMKELGVYEQEAMLLSLESYTLALFTRILEWTPERTHVLLAGVRREVLDRSIHMYGKIYFVYGQK